jgi:hypothetical protein
MKVVTNKVRAAFVNIFEKKLNQLSGKEEFSMCILIPKTDSPTIQRIQDSIKECIVGKWGSKPPTNLRTPLRDGDDTQENKGEDFKGHFFMNLKSSIRPGIVDRNLQAVIDPEEFTSGDYCRVSINPYAYDNKANKGVAFGLSNVQIVGKGASMTGRIKPEAEFTRIEDDTLPF